MQIGAEGTGLNCDAHLWWQNKVFRIKWRQTVAGGGGGSWRRRRRRRRILLPAVPNNVELWQTMRKRRQQRARTHFCEKWYGSWERRAHVWPKPSGIWVRRHGGYVGLVGTSPRQGRRTHRTVTS
eukprot:gene16064-biopygen15788